MKLFKRIFCFFMLGILLIGQVARVDRNNTYTGYNNMISGSWSPPAVLKANLPSAASVSGKVYVVTDGTSASDCTVGGGSTRALCISNGSAWVALGGGSGGAGTVTVIGSGNLTSTACVTGGGTQTIQTPNATCTIDASGNISTPGSTTTGNGGGISGKTTYSGTTSGGAVIGVADIAGSPNRINLPVATGCVGCFFRTDGGNPQQTSWVSNSSTVSYEGPSIARVKPNLCIGTLPPGWVATISGGNALSINGDANATNMSHSCGIKSSSSATSGNYGGVTDNGSAAASYGPGLDTLPTGASWTIGQRIKLTSITAVTANWGLANSTTDPTPFAAIDDEAAKFIFDTSSGVSATHFLVRFCKGHTCATDIDTGITAVAGTVYYTWMTSSVSGTINWHIQPAGGSDTTGAFSTGAAVPSGTMRWLAVIKTTANVNKDLIVYSMEYFASGLDL